MITLESLARSVPIAIGIDISIKSSALIAIAFLGHRLVSRTPVVRSAIWNALLVGLLALPVATLALPQWRIACLPAASEASIEASLTSPPIAALASSEAMAVRPEPIDPEPAEPIPFPETEAEAVNRLPQPSPVSTIPRPASQSLDEFNASRIVVGLYISVALMLMSRLAFSLAAVSRLVRRSLPVREPRWVSALETCRKRLSIGWKVSLLSSRKVSVPVAVGWLFPAVILPEAMAGEGESRHVEPVLLHELSHVRRLDYAWNLLSRMIQIVYWPNPLFRLVAPLIRDDRERACDDVCIHLLGDRHIYQATLLEVASGQVRRPTPALGMAMARQSRLAGRLAWIARSRGASRCLPRPSVRYAIVASLMAIASLIASIHLTRAEASKSAPPAAKAEEKKGRIFTLKVVDAKTGKPVKAMVVVFVAFKPSRQFTDDQGRLEIRHSMGGLSDSINTDISAEGLALQRHFWQEKPDAPIPDEATVKLLPGEKLGGVVRDKQGNPIQGATVLLWSHNYKARDSHELLYDLRSVTGADGRWETRSAPETTGEMLGIRLEHPDFVNEYEYHKAPSIADLRAGKAVSVMEKGTPISGRVVDIKGRPVAGAVVIATEREDAMFLESELNLTKSDNDGRFQFSHIKPGKVFIISAAKGHGPATAALELGSEPVAKVVRLGKSARFRGRVLDTSGKPIEGAYLTPGRLLRYRCLGGTIKSNADGHFEWDGPADEDVYFFIGREGYATNDGGLRATDQEVPVVLKRELHVHGEVRDSDLLQRLRDPALKIEIGRIEPGEAEVNWNQIAPTKSSYFDVRMEAENPAEFQFRILTKGYEPILTRRFSHDEGSVTYNLELTKIKEGDQKDLDGQVLMPSGKALAGAQVFLDILESGSNNFEIRDGKFANPDLKGVLTTDAEGRFKIPFDQLPEDLSGNLIVTQERFFGEITVKALRESGSTLKVRPWGRIEGKLRIGNKPAANATIHQSGNIGRSATLNHSTVISSTKTDSEGNFKFDQVVPGEVLVNGIPDDNKAPMKPMPRGWIDVGAGEVAMIQLGGTGRPVVATVFVPPDFKANRATASYSVLSTFEEPPVPKAVLDKGQAAYNRWFREWQNTPKGKAHKRRQVYLNGMGFNDDGIIRVEDIGPGEYVFDINMNDQGGKSLRYYQPFVMPPIPGDWSDEPLDLGMIKPIVDLPPLKTGDVALPFEAKSLEGKPITLDQFRGKTILLTCWTTWLEPFKIGDLPQLRALFEKHGKNPNFVMLSLNSDSDLKLADEFRKVNSFPGLHGWIQGGYGSTFHNDYLRLNQIPAIFLIGPDGKFIAVQLRGRGIVEAVDKVLGTIQ